MTHPVSVVPDSRPSWSPSPRSTSGTGSTRRPRQVSGAWGA